LFASTTEWQTKTRPDDRAAMRVAAEKEALPSTLSRPMGEGERAAMLLVLVNDADAVYPVRIDPTLSDANWISRTVEP